MTPTERSLVGTVSAGVVGGTTELSEWVRLANRGGEGGRPVV